MGGGIALAIAVWSVPWIAPAPDLPPGDAARLAYWLPWELLPLTTLAYGIAWIARYRFVHDSVIDGQNPMDDARLVQGRAFLQNTLEQFALALPVHAVLAIVLPARFLAVLPALSVCFAVSRVLFGTGYARGAAARSLGFAGTFYPTLVAMAVAAGCAILR